MRKKELAKEVISRLAERYPDAACALKWSGQPWRLLVMSRLSAQCTDKKVNAISVPLFEKYPTPDAMASCEIEELEAIIRPCGLYKMKAKNIKDSCAMLIEKFGGELPSDMDMLLSLPGVGRKIANLLRGDVFSLGGIVTDTHYIRITKRLGMYPEKEKNPARIERLTEPLIPKEKQTDFCHRIVLLGREICTAQSPKCHLCPLSDICKTAKKKQG